MRIERLKAGPITYLAFRGAFENRQLDWAREQLGAIVDEGERNLVFNFRRVDSVEPEPLRYLIEFHRGLLAKQGRLVISAAPPAIRSAILLEDADSPVRFADDDATAAGCFGSAAPPASEGADEAGGLRVRLKAKGDYHVLEWRGEIDPAQLASLRSGIDTLLNRGGTHIVLNLSRVAFITSAGISFIMEIHELLRAWGGRLVISDPAPFLSRTFNVLGLDEVVRIVDTDDEAAHYLRRREVPERSAVELTSRHAKRLGTARVEFQIFDAPEETAVGRLLYLWENGLAFAYPSEWGHSAIASSRLKLRSPLRLRIPHNAPGRAESAEAEPRYGEPGRWRMIEMEAEVELAREIEDDPIDALLFRVRYTRIDPEDRSFLDDVRREDLGDS